jgi:hypothetical protein
VVVYIPSLTLVGMIGTNSSSIRGDIYCPILVTSLSICSLHVITSPHLMARYPHHLTHILTSVLSISPPVLLHLGTPYVCTVCISSVSSSITSSIYGMYTPVVAPVHPMYRYDVDILGDDASHPLLCYAPWLPATRVGTSTTSCSHPSPHLLC